MKTRDKIVYEVDEEQEYLQEKIDDYDDERIECEMEEFLCERSASFFIQMRFYLQENSLYIGEYVDTDKIYDFVCNILEDQLENDGTFNDD